MENKEPTPAELLKMFADGAKIRQKRWAKNEYIFLKGNDVFDAGNACITKTFRPSISSILEGEYELYKEPKKLKRYWLWDINKDGWYRAATYLDENGVCTDNTGCLQELWHSLEKRKAEPEQYIDVEVD